MRIRCWITAAAAAAMLSGCGHNFPFGEKLLPETYGPPFGSALKDNLPHHPHNPAADERHAAADSAESRRYRSHAACHAALEAAVTQHHGAVVRISSIESMGHYRAGDEIHEHRCHDYVLSHRSWCVPGDGGNGHGAVHKRAESSCPADSSHP